MSCLLRFGPICAVLLAAPASGQVTIDLQALQALPGHNETSGASHYTGRRAAPPRRRAVARALPLPPIPPGEGTAVAATPAPTEAVPPQPAPHTPPRPTAPPAHGPAVAIGPLPTLPPAPPGPPAPVAPPQEPAGAPAVGQAAPQTAVVSFAQGQSTLAAPATQALSALAHTAANSPNATVNVLAYAPADPADPSAARRISLERALAIRTALMAGGVPSARIYLRALGSTGTTTPDHADVTVMGANLPATAQADAGKGKQQ